MPAYSPVFCLRNSFRPLQHSSYFQSEDVRSINNIDDDVGVARGWRRRGRRRGGRGRAARARGAAAAPAPVRARLRLLPARRPRARHRLLHLQSRVQLRGAPPGTQGNCHRHSPVYSSALNVFTPKR